MKRHCLFLEISLEKLIQEREIQVLLLVCRMLWQVQSHPNSSTFLPCPFYTPMGPNLSLTRQGRPQLVLAMLHAQSVYFHIKQGLCSFHWAQQLNSWTYRMLWTMTVAGYPSLSHQLNWPLTSYELYPACGWPSHMRACPKVGSVIKTRPIMLSIALVTQDITTTTDADKKLVKNQ